MPLRKCPMEALAYFLDQWASDGDTIVKRLPIIRVSQNALLLNSINRSEWLKGYSESLRLPSLQNYPAMRHGDNDAFPVLRMVDCPISRMDLLPIHLREPRKILIMNTAAGVGGECKLISDTYCTVPLGVKKLISSNPCSDVWQQLPRDHSLLLRETGY